MSSYLHDLYMLETQGKPSQCLLDALHKANEFVSVIATSGQFILISVNRQRYTRDIIMNKKERLWKWGVRWITNVPRIREDWSYFNNSLWQGNAILPITNVHWQLTRLGDFGKPGECHVLHITAVSEIDARRYASMLDCHVPEVWLSSKWSSCVRLDVYITPKLPRLCAYANYTRVN
jgi:hypothetical protein